LTILIAGEVDLPPENRAAALSGARELIAAALQEAGCRHYAWTADPFDPGRIHVFEQWDSEPELADHFKGDAYRGMLAHLGGHTILNSDTRKYRVDRQEPVYGADGIPSAQFTTMGAAA
jgi:quinol monooxygenase YgiN